MKRLLSIGICIALCSMSFATVKASEKAPYVDVSTSHYDSPSLSFDLSATLVAPAAVLVSTNGLVYADLVVKATAFKKIPADAGDFDCRKFNLSYSDKKPYLKDDDKPDNRRINGVLNEKQNSYLSESSRQ